MNSAAPDPDDYVTQKTRRIMARAALRKIGRLVAEWEEEDRLKDRWARIFTVMLVILALALCVVYPLLLAAFSSHPKVQLFTASVLLGVLVGVGWIWWPRRSSPAAATSPENGQSTTGRSL